MITNSTDIRDGTRLEFGMCIIGAGPAGITIARELSTKFKDICIIESGGLDYSRKIQELYCGDVTGDRYHPLHLSRLRYYGGSANHWGGASLPLDDFDFLKRDWIPYSGWPFGINELEPYYFKANDLLKIDNYSYDFDDYKSEKKEVHDYGLFNRVLQFSRLDRGKFGSYYMSELRKSKNITVLINCSAIKLQTDDQGGELKYACFKCLNGKSLSVKAKYYILAMGGIENARLLLLSRDVYKNGIGNQYDMVGRFFMDHIFYYSGTVKFNNSRIRNNIKPYVHDESGNQRKIGLISPYYKYLEINRISNCNTYLLYRPLFKLGEDYNDEGNISAMIIKDDLLKLRLPIQLMSNIKSLASGIDKVSKNLFSQIVDSFKSEKDIALRTCIEQVPNPENRVKLSDEKDALGINKVILKWQIGYEEKKTLETYHKYLISRLIRQDIREPELFGQDELNTNYSPGHHHMGTTKMSDDPKCGVVDKDCKVFGISNLFIAGSSVFPTGGVANPTLTIIALAIRLANHIKSKQDY